MVTINTKDLQELRQRTGAGMMDCKKALEETDGVIEQAIEYLRKKGMAKADKRAGRSATEGIIGSYIHHNGSIGVLVEVNCETDFVARTEGFQTLVKDLAMQVAAAAPRWVRREEVPPEIVAKEMEIGKAQAREQKKPEAIQEKIAKGKVEKFYGEFCLLEQPFVRDDKKKVADVVAEAVAKIGENIQVRRFARFVLGEGLEKKQENLAEEIAKVAAQAK
ncbi:MAG TPA: translation elongation factor Ts [Anaeromyxobacteraceae bacterium]|nr:translation elongation factor Ts [Anaeromyxobacteraceae bacterium]